MAVGAPAAGSAVVSRPRRAALTLNRRCGP